MTPAPAITEATMDKMTVEQVEHIRQYGYLNQEQLYALCDLAKLALSPPQDVAGLVEKLRDCHLEFADNTPVGYGPPINPDGPEAADALLSLSARNRALEAENCELRKALKPFAEEFEKNWPKTLQDDSHRIEMDMGDPGEFLVLESFITVGDLRRAANLQGNGDE